MSDFGDDMRAWRSRKREHRATFVECHCNYGGNYRKIPRDMSCNSCGFKGPDYAPAKIERAAPKRRRKSNG